MASPSIAFEPLPAWAKSLVFSNRFEGLGTRFFTRLAPTPLPDPRLAAFSPEAAALIGIDPSAAANSLFAKVFTGNALLQGMSPLASVYSGHQFGVWAGQLGDGRAILLGEVQSAQGAGGGWQCLEIQLKGAGLTPYSRMGDGRAVLRSSIREFLCSESMAGLGIPTTRALALTASDQPVIRETMETAAVATRMAPSFIRFGHFEHFAARRQFAELRQLADFVIDRFFPDCRARPNPYDALLAEVLRRSAEMVADWQAVGFCHGVMNTDNMSILGLTLDYGPFGFLDGFDINHVCNHSDTHGRYTYGKQPQVVHWNLVRLAEALLPLTLAGGRGGDPEAAGEEAVNTAVELARETLGEFPAAYAQAMLARMRAKLGLALEEDADADLIQAMYRILDADRVDHTLFFHKLSEVRRTLAEPSRDAPVRDLFIDREAWDRWAADYRGRLAREMADAAGAAAAMRRINPKYILRQHLAETAIRRANAGDFTEIERLRSILSRPYNEQPESEAYAGLPPDWASGLEVSCSS